MNFDCPICGGVVVWNDDKKNWVCRNVLPKIDSSFKSFMRKSVDTKQLRMNQDE